MVEPELILEHERSRDELEGSPVRTLKEDEVASAYTERFADLLGRVPGLSCLASGRSLQAL
jgi:hypothetical protein